MTVGARLSVEGAGRDVVSTDVALHANWGTAPVLTVGAGSNDAAGQLSVQAKATPGAGPTVILTFPKVKDKAPACFVTRGDAVANAAGEIHAVATTSALTITFDGTPVANETYVLNYLMVEL